MALHLEIRPSTVLVVSIMLSFVRDALRLVRGIRYNRIMKCLMCDREVQFLYRYGIVYCSTRCADNAHLLQLPLYRVNTRMIAVN